MFNEQFESEKEKPQRKEEEKDPKDTHVFVVDDGLSQMLYKRYFERLSIGCTICSVDNVVSKIEEWLSSRSLCPTKQKQPLPVVLTEPYMSTVSDTDILKRIREFEGKVLTKHEHPEKIVSKNEKKGGGSNDKVDSSSSDGKGRAEAELALNIPVIAVTCIRDQFLVNSGFDDVIQKPVDFTELIQRIRKY